MTLQSSEIESKLEALLDAELPSDEQSQEQNAEPTDDAVEEVEGSAEAETVEDPASEDDEEEVEAEAAEAPDEEDSEEAEAESIDTAEALAKSFEMEPDEFFAAIKVDDSTTLADLLKSHQEAPQAVLKSEELALREKQIADAKAELEAEREESNKKLETQLERMAMATDAMLKEIEGEQATDWEALKRDDPNEYALRYTEHQQRKDKVNQSLELMRQMAADTEQQQKKAHQEFVAKERQQLFEKMPAWVDQEKRDADFKQIETSLRAAGFEDQDFMMLDDHRVLLQAWKAAQWDALQAKGKLAVKRVRQTPKKIVRSGARVDRSREKVQKRHADLRKRVRANGKDTNALEALMETVLEDVE